MSTVVTMDTPVAHCPQARRNCSEVRLESLMVLLAVAVLDGLALCMQARGGRKAGRGRGRATKVRV